MVPTSHRVLLTNLAAQQMVIVVAVPSSAHQDVNHNTASILSHVYRILYARTWISRSNLTCTIKTTILGPC